MLRHAESSGDLRDQSPRTPPDAAVGTRLVRSWAARAPGLALCALLGGVALGLGRLLPVLGYAIPAIVLGILTGLVLDVHAPREDSAAHRLAPGIRFSAKLVLQCGVVLLGAQLSLASILAVGAQSFPVMLVSLCACLTGARLVGRRLGVSRDLRTLIGVGTGICGASAIAAVSPVVRARHEDVSYAVSTIFLFNIVGVAVFPVLGHAFGLSPRSFGLFAGTAVNDTSSVVAAATVFGGGSLAFAVVVKLVRTLMIVPVSVGLAVLTARRERREEPAGQEAPPAGTAPGRLVRLVPWFLVGFLLLAAASSLGWVPDPARSAMGAASAVCVATALAGIGLSTDLRAVRAAGARPLALGGILSVLVIATTLGMMDLTGSL